MIIIVAILLLTTVTSIIISTLLISDKVSKANSGKNIVDFFEPDNLSPELSEMIDFHKKNGSIDYEI